VLITGHGPLAAGHIIDLSKAAAARLDMVADGAATVRVRRIDDTQAGTKRHIDIW